MTISYIQFKDAYFGSTASSTVAITSGLNVSSGNFIVAAIGAYSSTAGNAVVTGVQDTIGNTYSKAIGAYRTGSAGERIELWYSENIAAQSNNLVTASFTNTASFRYISVAEFSGVATSSSLDDTSSQSNSSATTHSTGLATASTTSELILGALNAQGTGTFTVGSGFSTLSSDTTGVYYFSEYQILSTAGDYDANCSSSATNSNIFACAIFKPAAGGAPGFTGTSWHACDTTTSWSIANGGGTLNTTSTYKTEGSYALYRTKDVGATDWTAYNDAMPMLSASTASVFAVYFRRSSAPTSSITNLSLNVGNDSANFIQKDYGTPTSSLTADTWVQLTFGAANADSTQGTVNWNAIDYFRLYFNSANGANFAADELCWDDIRFSGATLSSSTTGWAEKILGISPAKVTGLATSSISKINGV